MNSYERIGRLFERVEVVEDQLNKAIQVIVAVKTGTLTMDRITVHENGQGFSVSPAAPLDSSNGVPAELLNAKAP